MKLLIFGSPDRIEVKWLLKEAKKAGHKAETASFYNITIQTQEKAINIDHTDVDLLDYDVFLFRGITKHLWEGLLLAEWLYKKGKIVVDERLATKRYIPTKLSTSVNLARAGIAQPRTFAPGGIKSAKKLLSKINYPVIMKDSFGRKGQDVFLVKDKKSAIKVASEFKSEERPYLIQEYIPVKSDTRIFVVGNKALGGMKRTAPENDFRSNISIGGTGKQVDLTKEMAELAISATKATFMEITGVDILEHNGSLYVLEVNRCPQFRGFQKSTGINVAKEIIDYLELRSSS